VYVKIFSVFLENNEDFFTSKNNSREIGARRVTLFRIDMILLTFMYLKSVVLTLILVTVYSSK